MSSPINKCDINEVFENILFAEEVAEKIGFEEGFKVGKKQSVQGYHLGYHRGSELAARLGYYSGVLEHCMNKNIFPQKVVEQATILNEEINKFPKTNDESVDIIKLSEDIKFKYNRICSLAKISSSYPEADNLNF